MKNIAVVTGTRAEYGLLKPLIKAIDEDKDLKLQLLVTGMHLMPEFGNTYLQIEEDGFKIDSKIEDGLNGDDALDISKAIGRATIGFAETYNELKPDLLVVLGDRSEMLAAVTAAVIANIPIAHIHGGETTEGAYDEFVRHAITKMSHIHFASCEAYRKRIIQMGEQPSMVHNVGAIGIDSIKNLKLLSKEAFELSIGRRLMKKNVLITFHPVTLEVNTAAKQFRALLESLDKLNDTMFIFTKPNSDKEGKRISGLIDNYVTINSQNTLSFSSLGQLRYLSALQYIDVVVGNSSSGILEVPMFAKPTINIGDRQKGRLMPQSVINCNPTYEAINQAFEMAYSPEFLEKIKRQHSIYGNGTATRQIMKIIKTCKITSLKKRFYDLSFKYNE